MKKILSLTLLVLSMIFISGCGTSKDTWQGSYYKHGEQKNELYGPVFNNYKGCKAWALGKIVNSDDTAVCSKNCHDSLGDTPVCEEVVRNWAPMQGSKTFENYKE